MNRALMTLVLSAFAVKRSRALDLRANEQPLPVTRDPQAIAKICRAIACRARDARWRSSALIAAAAGPAGQRQPHADGSDSDIACLLAGSLWPEAQAGAHRVERLAAGHASGCYDVALITR